MRKARSSSMLYRLIYCSRRIATDEGVVESILAVARRNNQQEGLTGALLVTDSGFAQVLEGARDAVERAFERIGADRRHAEVTVLSFTPSERRCFADWSMAYNGRLPADVPDPVQSLLTPERQRCITGNDILRLMESVIYRDSPAPV